MRLRHVVMSVLLLLVTVVATNVSAAPITYVLGPGDVIQISVWKDPELSRETVVRPDGKISFPLINDVDAAGMSVDELRQVIQKRIKEYVPGSPVSVVLQRLGSRKVYVVGKVQKPGLYIMDSEMTVMQALALAGGLTPFASESITVLRRGKDGGETMMKFDYGAAGKGRDSGQNIVLQSDDTIIVP